MRTALIVVAVAAALLRAAPAAADPGFRVVVNAANPATSLSRTQVSQLFLKRDKRWASGDAVQPVQPADAALRERFSTRVHGKGAAAVRAYWNQLIFSGREVPPVEKKGDDEIVAYVRANPGAIGYVSPGAVTAGVKVVTVEE
jgi:ABC-type phosphate transport system substrate-binding protein